MGTREIFPNRITTAVRQKARWILGISFQGWQQLAWQGSLASRYFLLRDRKAVFCGHATLVSSLGLIYSLLQQMAQGLALPPLLAEGDWLWQLAWVNLGFLVHRLLVRHLCVWSVYGWQQLPFVTPRYLVATFVNYLALCRASGIFARHLLTGRPIGWDKTTHAFPSGDPNQRAPSLSRPGLEGAV